LKNHLIKKKIVVGYLGSNSVLARSFKKKYFKKFSFKTYHGDITNLKKISSWIKKNTDINIIINFAAITSPKICEKFKKKAKEVNYSSVVKLLNFMNKDKKCDNFYYFLSISTSHVFKKSNLKLKENSEKKPSNYYGKSKLALEKYILNNQNKFKFNVGIARIFNYYNQGLKKGFFVNDVVKKLKENKNTATFYNINSYRDFISMEDINKGLFKMINLKLKNDYNICSGQKIYLPSIIYFLNKKFKKKIIIINNKINYNLLGSNSKLKSKGWSITQKNFFNELQK